MSEVPPAIMRQLEAGTLATVNLVEWLALDQRTLVRTVLAEIGQQRLIEPVLTATATEWRMASQHFPAETADAIDDMLELLEPIWRQDTQRGPSVDDLLAEARIDVVQRDVQSEDDELNADPSKFNWYWLEFQSHTPDFIASVRLDVSSGVGVGHASLTIRLEGE